MREVDKVIEEYRKTARGNALRAAEQTLLSVAMCISCGAIGGVIALRLAGVH